MKRILDLNYGIPYFTNSNDQLFGWYVIYNDKAVILEINNFSNVKFNEIPKTNIQYFGLYGCGFHLTCNFKDKSLFLYKGYNENEYLYECKYNLFDATYTNELEPFQFKGFIYDAPIKNVCKEKFCINSFYLGWNENISIYEKEFINKIYFVVDIINHPKSIGLIYKLIPKDLNFDYSSNNYRLSISDNSTYINEKEKSTNDNKYIILNKQLKYKTIIRFG